MEDARLYHFPLSHFCEKARWAFDYKGLPYRSEVLLPGPHRLTVKRLTGKSTTVPVAVIDQQILETSNAIIDYLDQRYPERPLTPKRPEDRALALDWEARLDKIVGIATRRAFYHHALEHPRFVIPLYTHGGPWWGKLFYAGAFPAVRSAIRKMYQPSPERIAADAKQLWQMITELDEHFERHNYLVGDDFTRADLTLASLLGSVLGSKAGPSGWPPDEEWPEQLLEFARPLRETRTAERVRYYYATHRSAN